MNRLNFGYYCFFIILLIAISCKQKIHLNKEIKIDFDIVYTKVLEIAFHGKCFRDVLPYNRENKNSNKKEVFNNSYYYFPNRFENFINDSTLIFENKVIDSLKYSKPYDEIDSFKIKKIKNLIIKTMPYSFGSMDFKELPNFAYQFLKENSTFDGFIIFSKPIIQNLGKDEYELLIRVDKMIDTPRSCYVRLILKDNIIKEAAELQYRTALTFR